jgi:hypothetical protein
VHKVLGKRIEFKELSGLLWLKWTVIGQGSQVTPVISIFQVIVCVFLINLLFSKENIFYFVAPVCCLFGF